MKRISYLAVLAVAFSLFTFSCSDDDTYAELLKKESKLIDEYIKRNNINVLTSFPKVWGENDYVLTESGLYFHLVDSGSGLDTLEIKDKVIPRYKQYTLGVEPDTISNWSTIHGLYPKTYTFGAQGQPSEAFQEAFRYMKKNESQAKLIVPSKIGESQNLRSVTPLGYHLKIQIQK